MSSQATSHSPPATDSDEVLVRVQGVSKKFCRSLKRSLWYGVCDIAGELSPFGRRPRIAEVTSHESRVTGEDFASGGNNPRVTSHQPLATASPCGDAQPATSYLPPVTLDGLRPGEFWAVRDVSFELRRGECLGLIGHNGAGKTTLLKMLNGLIKPDTGRIEMNGRVGALIALGAGFNPILTGRENIYINCSVLGLSKKEPERRKAWRTESPGGLKEVQPKVGPKGAASGDASHRLPHAGPQGFAFRAKREPNRREDRRDHRLCCI